MKKPDISSRQGHFSDTKCCICDVRITNKYLEYLKRVGAISTYIEVCQDHGHLRHVFDMKKPPGGNYDYIKHLRVEHGNESEI